MLSPWMILLFMGVFVRVCAIEDGSAVDDPTLYPFFCMLGNPHVCGGTILTFDPPTVLTAAHCVADAPKPATLTKNPYFVSYGHPDRRHQRNAVVVDWTLHPSYHNADMHHDVAILRLDRPLERVARAALWPASQSLPPFTRGSLMGYGYTGVHEPEATVMQRISLEITHFIPNSTDMVEAVASENDTGMACHGDSGSPLVVHVAMDRPGESNQTKTLVPFVLGPLARIFGVHDPDPSHQTCPQRHPYVKAVESFSNIQSKLDWISSETNLTVAQLIDPFFELPQPPPSAESLQANNSQAWHIGFTDHDYDQNHDSFFIGPVMQDFISHAGPSAMRPTVNLLSYSLLVMLATLYPSL